MFMDEISHRFFSLCLAFTLVNSHTISTCLFRTLRQVRVGKLTRNVTAEHLREIFGAFGAVAGAEVLLDRTVRLPTGNATVEFETHDQVGFSDRCGTDQEIWRVRPPLPSRL